MDFKVVWTEPAIESLGAIVTEVAAQNPAAALQLGTRLVERMEITTRFPESGPLYRQAEPLVVRWLTVDSYRLYYRVSRETSSIEVLAVRHCARALPVF